MEALVFSSENGEVRLASFNTRVCRITIYRRLVLGEDPADESYHPDQKELRRFKISLAAVLWTTWGLCD